MESQKDQHKWLLSDQDLKAGLAGNPLVYDESNPNKISSTFEANSGTVILHIGCIERQSRFGGPEHDNSILSPGDMALVLTEEKIHIPNNCVGVVFGTNTRTMSGLLLVNPGIITGGHNDEITFLLTNISKQEIPLAKGKSIARLLVFHYPEENGASNRSATDSQHAAKKIVLNTLYPNLHGLVGSRIEKDLKKKFKNLTNIAFAKFLIAGIGVLVIGAFMSALVGVVVPTYMKNKWEPPDVAKQVDILEDRVRRLEQTTAKVQNPSVASPADNASLNTGSED